PVIDPATPEIYTLIVGGSVSCVYATPPPQQAAPALGRAVRRGELPGALPADREFAFGADPEAMARAYEGAWLACRLIASRWGDAALVRLYERAGREPLETALEDTIGGDPPGLTLAWQASLRQELGAP
ncbi:hypothetical protein ACFXA3_23145, partial [Streptomyces sp. NPDC059456]